MAGCDKEYGLVIFGTDGRGGLHERRKGDMISQHIKLVSLLL